MKIKNIESATVQNKKQKIDKKVSFHPVNWCKFVEKKLPVTKDYSYQHKEVLRQEYLRHAIEKKKDFRCDIDPRWASNEKFSKFLLSDDCDHDLVEKRAQQRINKDGRWR